MQSKERSEDKKNSSLVSGIETLLAACDDLYPNQSPCLLVRPKVKYLHGGCNPLVVCAYFNPGNPASDITRHWHYIGFGLCLPDLHGDGRVHKISGVDTPSGYGFELTFRLKAKLGEDKPPLWPTVVMEIEAEKVLLSNIVFSEGDCMPCNYPFNASSRIQHFLISEDSQLGTVRTPFGPVTFLQMVGVCTEELKAAQQGSGQRIIDLMKSVEGAGGPWLITDMNRDKTIFEMDSFVQKAVEPCVTFSDHLSAWWNGLKALCTTSSKKDE